MQRNPMVLPNINLQPLTKTGAEFATIRQMRASISYCGAPGITVIV